MHLYESSGLTPNNSSSHSCPPPLKLHNACTIGEQLSRHVQPPGFVEGYLALERIPLVTHGHGYPPPPPFPPRATGASTGLRPRWHMARIPLRTPLQKCEQTRNKSDSKFVHSSLVAPVACSLPTSPVDVLRRGKRNAGGGARARAGGMIRKRIW